MDGDFTLQASWASSNLSELEALEAQIHQTHAIAHAPKTSPAEAIPALVLDASPIEESMHAAIVHMDTRGMALRKSALESPPPPPLNDRVAMEHTHKTASAE